MTYETSKWFKGSFPMWVASSLLGVCVWLGQHGLATIEEELKTNRELVAKLEQSQGLQDTRIVSLETQVKDMKEVFTEMRSDFRLLKEAQVGTLAELKKMGAQLEMISKK